MSTLAIWCRVVHSRDVSPYIFDGHAMSGLAFSVPPYTATGESLGALDRTILDSSITYITSIIIVYGQTYGLLNTHKPSASQALGAQSVVNVTVCNVPVYIPSLCRLLRSVVGRHPTWP